MRFFKRGLVAHGFLCVCLMFFLLCLLSCFRPKTEETGPQGGEDFPTEAELPDLEETIARLIGGSFADEIGFTELLSEIFRDAEIPEAISLSISEGLALSPAFIIDLLICLEGEKYLRTLVDKQHPLPEAYAPQDLVELRNGSFTAARSGLMLRKAAADGLEEMAAAARLAGLTLTVSSAYRSYSYQTEVYNRIVRELGQEEADRESARPGFSQHQTGLALDFGSIDDSFADTTAGRWLAVNASRFGWSLSFPKGYEAVTGYRWESWHYRYIGKDLAVFAAAYFGGIQQYALRFLYEWELWTGDN